MNAVRMTLAGALLGLFLCSQQLAGAAAPGTEKKEEPAVTEDLRVAKNSSRPSLDRIDAIRRLSRLSRPEEIRDLRVIDDLVGVAKETNDDMFVRNEAIQALGDLQVRNFPQDEFAKKKYMGPFRTILKDSKESVHVRESIVRTFALTLNPTGIQDKEAFADIAAVLLDKSEITLLRIACAEAVGAYTSEKSIGVLAEALSQLNLEAGLKEKIVEAFAQLLTRIPDIGPVTFAVSKKIEGIATDKEMTPEIRAMGILALAQLQSKGAKVNCIPILTQILNTELHTGLLIASIQALGVVGDVDGLDALDNALKAFQSDPKLSQLMNQNRAEVRLAGMKALGNILSLQNAKPNAVAIGKCVDMLLRALELSDDPKKKGPVEDPEIVRASVFSLRYLYPKKPAFEAPRTKAIGALIILLEYAALNKQEDLVREITDSLKYLTDKHFGPNAKRWIDWHQGEGMKIKK